MFDNLQLNQESLEILEEEYKEFKLKIKNYDEDTPYYVYGLFDDGGVPVYIGKGKGPRAFHHIKSLNREEITSLKDEMINFMLDHNHPPIVFIFKGNMSQKEAIEKEGELIEEIGRICDGGTLTNIMKSGGYFDIDDGLRYKLKLSGRKLYREGKGIHGASQEMRSKWGKSGAEALKKYGTRGGVCSPEWQEQNKDLQKENATNAGMSSWKAISSDEEKLKRHKEYSSTGGNTTGKMVFWTNGTTTTRSYSCPGEGWYRGNCNVSENSKGNFNKPFWTNGVVNRTSDTKPGDDFFNGMTRKTKAGMKEVIVFKNQHESNKIPNHLKFGKNVIGRIDE